MIMKKQNHFLVYLLLLITTIGINKLSAQTDPTFEQTVDYIIKNTKGRVMYPGALDSYNRVKGYVLKDVKIDKTGRIELFTDQKFDDNKFSINFNIFDLVQKVDYPDGIRAYKFLVHFNGLNVSSGYGITFATDADAQKIARAFRYLKQVCTPENDLFSQIPAEEKKIKLTREETIDYINKLINFDRPLIDHYSTNSNPKYKRYNYFKKENLGLSYDYSSKTYQIKYKLSSCASEGGTLNFGNASFYSYRVKFANYHSISIKKTDNRHNGGKTLETLEIHFNSDNYNDSRAEIYFPVNSDYGDKIYDLEGTYSKEIKKLAKAFERLKELDSDEKDPFED